MSIAHQESLKVCNGCGEIYDANIEAESVHHNQPDEHAPLLPPRRPYRRPSRAMVLARAA